MRSLATISRANGCTFWQCLLYYMLKNICVSSGQHFALPIKRYLPKYSSVDWEQLRTIFWWCAVGNLSPSFEVIGVEGFQNLTSGNTTYTSKCDGESYLRITVACVTSVPIGQALWMHAKG